MIVRQDKSYETSSLFPNSNWYEDEPDNYIVDETTEEGQALAAKIREAAPYMDLVIDNGVLVDVTPLTKPEPPPPEPDRISQLEDENAMLALELVNTQIAIEQTQDEQADMLLMLVEAGVI